MKRPILALSTALALAASPALAHTGVGPTAGLAAGFTHPLFGLDHLLAMIAVGLLAAQLGGRALWAVPAAFVAAMIAASVVGMAGLPLPLVELGIAASVVVLGATVLSGRRLPVAGAMALAGAFALFHGHAHGAEMPADATALAYGAGFVAATLLLHGAGLGLGLAVRRTADRLGPALLRAAGGMVAATGLLLAAG
jgi:urease accessory protein